LSAKPKPSLTFIVDTREQSPYQFSRAHRRDVAFGGSRRAKLDEGDYGVMIGEELLPIRIERKSIGDLFGVVGKGRERFERELDRLSGYASYLMIEATLEQVKHGFERSLVSGEAALGSVLCWSVTFGISPIFAGNWRLGNSVTQRLLEDFAAHYRGGK